jgi:hypothetical protein
LYEVLNQEDLSYKSIFQTTSRTNNGQIVYVGEPLKQRLRESVILICYGMLPKVGYNFEADDAYCIGNFNFVESCFAMNGE